MDDDDHSFLFMPMLTLGGLEEEGSLEEDARTVPNWG
jgi:hypothetical protein